MAWYTTNKNGGHKGAYGVRPEPGYGRNAYPGNVQPALVVQSEYHNAQRYEYEAEEVVEYRHGGGGLNIPDHRGSPRTKDGLHQGLVNKAQLFPRKPTHDWSDSGNESSPKAHTYEKNKGGSPQYFNNNAPHGLNNHRYPKPQSNYGRYSNSSSGDEDNDSGSDNDVVCVDGVCYPNPRGNKAKPNSHIKDDGYEKPKANNRAHHTVPHASQPSKDPYYEKPSNSNHRYYESPNRNTPSAPAYGTAPHIAQDGNHRPSYKNPPQIVTKPRNESPKNTITSSQAKQLYGGVSVNTEPKYNGTIDCQEAAKRYNGILLPGNY